MSARLNEGLLAVKPCEFTLNGAPVKGLLDVNLGVKGYLYDLDLTLDRVPIQPLMDSANPSKAGLARGEACPRVGRVLAALPHAVVRDHHERSEPAHELNRTQAGSGRSGR